MPHNPDIHHRHSIRLREYDYAQEGAYFVTICTVQKQCLLGEVEQGAIRLSRHGQAANVCWQWLAQRYSYVELDVWIVMPNHLHGILVIRDESDVRGEGGSRTAPTPTDATSSSTTPTSPLLLQKRKTLGRLIGAFKTTSTKAINEFYHSPGETLWQRNYYEHVVQNEADHKRIREYILSNPARWENDEYYSQA